MLKSTFLSLHKYNVESSLHIKGAKDRMPSFSWGLIGKFFNCIKLLSSTGLFAVFRVMFHTISSQWSELVSTPQGKEKLKCKIRHQNEFIIPMHITFENRLMSKIKELSHCLHCKVRRALFLLRMKHLKDFHNFCFS